MGYQVTPFALVFILIAIISSCVATIAWLRRKSPGGLALFLLMLAIMEWSLAAGLEAAAVSQATKILWSKIEYLGAHTSPVFLLIFVVQYARRDRWLNRRNIGLLFILPAITILLAATNEWHHLVWSSFSPGLPGSNLIIYNHGPWFYIAIVSVYAFIFYATVILIQHAIHSMGVYRQQAIAMIVATVAPWLSTSIYIFNLNPLPGLDTTLIGFSITGVILTWSIYRFQLLDLVPVAWEALFKNMKEGILVVDAQNRIADINPAARKLLGKTDSCIGENIEVCLESQIDPPGWNIGNDDSQTEITLNNPEKHNVELQITTLCDQRGNLTCKLLIFRDISSAKNAEVALQDAIVKLSEQVAEINCLHDQLREESIRDIITGLYNRRYLIETLGRELLRALREDYPVTLLMLDIDHFKEVNEKFGNSAGDALIEALGKLLNQKTRGSDIACRYGGDEFILVLPGVNLKTARKRAEEWRTDFENLWVTYQDLKICATISVGVAVYPLHGINTDEMLHAVDEALCEAKSAGRNCVKVRD